MPSQFSSLVRFVTPYKGTLILALTMMLAASAISLLIPWFAGHFTAALLNDSLPFGLSLQALLLIWLLIFALKGLLGFGNQYLIGASGERMLARVRQHLYDHLQALPLSYYHEQKRGEVLALMTNDAGIISNYVTGTLLGLLPLLFSFFGALVIIFFINPLIAVLISLIMPLFYLLMKVLGRKIRPISRTMIDEYANTFSVVEENLNLLPVIKSFTRETLESERFQKGNLRLLTSTSQYLKIQALLQPAVQFLAAAGVLLLLWVGVQQIQAGQLDTADLVSLLLYGLMLTSPISGLASVYGQTQRARGAAERLIQVFSLPSELLDEGDDLLSPVKGEIEFRDVYFAYPGRDNILHGLNLKIEAGETVAITGKNGCGKSTLVHLLSRFTDPQTGQILIDGMETQSMSLSSLRNQIGTVQQQVLLLNGTVRENILFGMPDATDVEIDQASKAAQAWGFIQQLPQGFDTIVGDQGIKLSGGQRQRLALARALLKNPPILVLDEATAMFDPEGEKSFIEECHESLQQRTVILITHRPASLALADRVLHIEDGHAQLDANPAKFAQGI